MEKVISEGIRNLGCLSNTGGIIELRTIDGCGKFGPRFDNDVKSELYPYNLWRKAIHCRDINWINRSIYATLPVSLIWTKYLIFSFNRRRVIFSDYGIYRPIK